jgi:hypothetical protein
VAVLGRRHRIVFAARAEQGVALIEVVCAGPRAGNAVYDVANALVRWGRLTEEEATQVGDALALLEVVAEDVGIDGWDYRSRPAEARLVRALVQLGLLPRISPELFPEPRRRPRCGTATTRPDSPTRTPR